MSECKVKSFVASWSEWEISMPAAWSKTSTIRLPVKFRLELEDSGCKANCVVAQQKRGRSEINGYAGEDHVFPTFVADGDIGELQWWDGQRMARTGMGRWESAGGCGGPETVAIFEDKPGFNKAPAGQSLYMGAATGRSGYFDFKTYVMEKDSGRMIKEINWSMRIDVPNPGKGGFWWSFSDQK